MARLSYRSNNFCIGKCLRIKHFCILQTMKKYLLWLFLFCGYLQLSCTSELHINTTIPAEVPVATDQWKVVAINRYNPDFLPEDQEKIAELYANGAQEAFYGAIDAILEDSTYYLVHADSLNLRMQAPGDTLGPRQLREIYQKYPHHLLLSLDNFDISMEEDRVMIENSDGSSSTTANYFLVTRSSWTLFDSTGTVLDKVTLMQEEPYKSRPVFFGILAIGPSLNKATPVINRLAWLTGYDYWRRLSPQPTTFVRPYYTMGKLKEASAAMAVKDWKTAITLLEPIAEGKQQVASKAAYNLAVVYEAMGRIDTAKRWASFASLKRNKLAPFLLAELENYGQ